MKLSWAVEIAGTGLGVPERTFTNDYFAQRLDTSDEWIVKRTGIRERRMVGPGESTSTLALAASRGPGGGGRYTGRDRSDHLRHIHARSSAAIGGVRAPGGSGVPLDPGVRPGGSL